MAKLLNVIAQVDDIKPNAFSRDTKIRWLNEVEGTVQAEVLLIAPRDIVQYEYTEGENPELLAPPPHDKLYNVYLSAMIDFANGEYNKYENTMQLFNACFGEYMRWYARVCRPADTGAFDGEVSK